MLENDGVFEFDKDSSSGTVLESGSVVSGETCGEARIGSVVSAGAVSLSEVSNVIVMRRNCKNTIVKSNSRSCNLDGDRANRQRGGTISVSNTGAGKSKWTHPFQRNPIPQISHSPTHPRGHASTQFQNSPTE